MDVVFAVVPFADVARPAIGVSLLKAELARVCSAGVLYLNLDFAAAIGSQLYQHFCHNVPAETMAGEWFFAVEHPWYSSTRYFAGGVTFNFADVPLTANNRDVNRTFSENQEIVDLQYMLHIDVAASFLDRVQVSASLPITLDEANRAGRLKPGDLIVMMSIGAGMAWGSALVRW